MLATVPLSASGPTSGTAPTTQTLAADTYNVTANFSASASDYFKNSASAKLAVDVQAWPRVQFSTNGVNVLDIAGTVTLTVKRVGSTLGAASVNYATADGTARAGTDYATAAGTLR